MTFERSFPISSHAADIPTPSLRPWSPASGMRRTWTNIIMKKRIQHESDLFCYKFSVVGFGTCRRIFFPPLSSRYSPKESTGKGRKYTEGRQRTGPFDREPGA